MRKRFSLLVGCLALGCLLLAAGCDPVVEGVVSGISSGVAAVVENFFSNLAFGGA